MSASRLFAAVVATFALVAPLAPAAAQKPPKSKYDGDNIPRCTKKLGTIAINDPETRWWEGLGLSNPEALIKHIVRTSGCFTVVNRGRGLAMRDTERALSGGGELQRGSNLGLGQVKAADFFLIPDISGANRNASGGGVGAGLGRLFGGTIGGIVGGISVKKKEARTLLTVVNARTTEEVLTAEGFARKTDVGFGAGGFLGFAGAAGGGYENTEIGRVITLSYIDAYRKMIDEMGGEFSPVTAAAPQQAFRVVRTTSLLSRSSGGKAMKSLASGDVVYPTGAKSGVMIEVADEFDIKGWVTTEAVRPG